MTMDVRTQLWDWLSVAVVSAVPEIEEDTVDQKLVWSMQKAQPSAAPFVSLHLVQFAEDNATEVRDVYVDDAEDNPAKLIEENVLCRALGTVAVSVFGVGAVLHCFNIKAALREWASIEAMQNSKLGLVGVGATQNVSALLETAFEERATFMLDFYIEFAKVTTKGSIGHVPLLGTTDLAEGDLYNVTETIDEPT